MSETSGPARETRAVGGDLVIPVMALTFAAYFFTDIDDLDWEAAANGIVVGALLVGLCVIQIARTLLVVARGDGSLGLGRLIAPRGQFGLRVGLVVLMALFVWCIAWTGVTLGIFLVSLAMLLLLGVRDWRGLVFMPVGLAAVVYLLFVVLLQAKLPKGPAEKLLNAVFGLGG